MAEQPVDLSPASAHSASQASAASNGRRSPCPLEISGLSCERGGRLLFQNISLSLRPGTVTAILGANGAGKSTLLSLMANLDVLPEESVGKNSPALSVRGQISLLGRPLTRWKRREIAQNIALLQQSPVSPFSFTVEEVVMLGRAPWQDALGHPSHEDWQIVQKSLSEVGLMGLAQRPMDALSGGERQRVFLAQALAQTPKILLLDEPTAFLDMKQQAAIWQIVRAKASQGLAIAAILHDPAWALNADQVLILFPDGSTLTDSPENALTEANLSRAYGISIVRIGGSKIGEGAFVTVPRA